jgi:hypothetical protein
MGDFKFHFWPTEYRKITQHFGANPQNYAQFGLPGHDGMDIRAPSGSKVFCVAPGEVSQVHRSPTGHNYGIHVRVKHRDGYLTVYAHLQEAFVREGDRVDAGTILGLADNTGNSFGNHLHITLKKEGARIGNWPYNIIDPTPFLLPLIGWQEPSGPYVGGWVLSAGITQYENLAQANPDGVTLRAGAARDILISEGTLMIVTGPERDGYTPVQVPRAAVGLDDHRLPETPAPDPPPNITTINGWAWADYLKVVGDRAIVNTPYGINLRAKPDRESTNIGVLRSGSTVTVLARPTNQYLPVRVRRVDFTGPVNLPDGPPDPPVHFLEYLPEGIYLGWAPSSQLQLNDPYANARHSGVNLLSTPSQGGKYVSTVKGDATVTLAGPARDTYTPILANKLDLFNIASPLPEVELPDPFPDDRAPIVPFPHPPHDNTPGWVLSSDVNIDGDYAIVGPHGLTLRDAPRRDGENVGFIPPSAVIVVTGPATGEFTPVRVDEEILQPPMDESLGDPDEDSGNPDPGMLGHARIGLHASADPIINEAEHQEFANLRPGIIKVLSFHGARDIDRLAEAHPTAGWIVRAFLDFGGRNISPQQFLNDTINDVKRALNRLPGKDVVVELHNEPNVVAEGLNSSWRDGATFSKWWLELLALYRQALPGARFIYPGLSPGTTVTNVKLDHIQFIEAGREAVEAADGLGVHLYWSNVYPMERTLDILDDFISRFRFKPIWVTEASNNKPGTPVAKKAHQYLQLWHALQKRPVVRGVTFFVASASNPDFAEEVWVGRGIGSIVGRR